MDTEFLTCMLYSHASLGEKFLRQNTQGLKWQNSYKEKLKSGT